MDAPSIDGCVHYRRQNKNGIIKKTVLFAYANVRRGVKDIRVMGRNTQGVRVINFKDGDSIADIAKVVVEDVNGNGNGNSKTENKDVNKEQTPGKYEVFLMLHNLQVERMFTEYKLVSLVQ